MGHLDIPEPLALLIETIDKKWIPIYEEVPGAIDLGTNNCSLCKKYHVAHSKIKIVEENGMCHKLCPIKKITKIDGCQGTPYERFSFYNYKIQYCYTDEDEPKHQLRLLRKTEALKFLRFLILMVPNKLRRPYWAKYFNSKDFK